MYEPNSKTQKKKERQKISFITDEYKRNYDFHRAVNGKVEKIQGILVKYELGSITNAKENGFISAQRMTM